VRAAGVFEGAEHYGTFCVAAASIFLYSERGLSRILFVGIIFSGCALSLSSGPLLGLVIVTAVFTYDCILRQYTWRWKALATVLGGLVLGIFLISAHPIAWIITHITLDPQTGFFRLGTWNYALPLIGQSPFIGYGVVEFGDSSDALIFLKSVDCVWLLEALRYGLPAVMLLLLTMISALFRKTIILEISKLETGLSLAIISMALIGLTVHFWDATWLLLSLCIGIRASLSEYAALR
jgi:hypothetical protein